MSTRARGPYSKANDPFRAQRERYRAVLSPLGWWERFAALPRPFQEYLWKRPWSGIVLEFDAGFPQDKALRHALTVAFRDASFTIDEKKINAGNFLEVLTVIAFVVVNMPVDRRFDPAVARFINEGRPAIPALINEHSQAAMKAACHALNVHLFAASRMDTQLLNFRYTPGGNTEGYIRSIFTCYRTAAQRIEASIEGMKREMFRIGGKGPSGEMEWTAWEGSAIGRRPGKRYPVYIQAHALRQLRKRIDLPGFAPYLDAWLDQATSELEVVERMKGGHLLVAFRLSEKRVGYLLASPLGEKMVIRTFLFLTMRITPEGRKLEQQFNLTRDEVDYLGLHELSRFTRTDIKLDKRLRKKLAKCGCEHLLDLDERKVQPEPIPFAAELKRYVGIAA